MYSVLLVDDEPLVRMGISTILKRFFTDIIVCGEAADGEKAIELTKKHNPELVITDIRMPVLDGFKFVKYLHEFNEDIVVIVLTGYDDFLYAKEMIKYNIYSYTLKPIDTDEFIELIKNAKKESINRRKQQNTNNFLNSIYKVYKQLYNCDYIYNIHTRDMVGLTKSISAFFNYLIENKISYDHVCLILIELTNVIEYELKFHYKKKDSFIESLKSCGNIEELKQRLITYSMEMLTNVYEEDNLIDRSIKVIENIKIYVTDNLDGDLSLTNIGKIFHFNESYLSTLFKTISGENFIDYVTKIRLEKAISYLENRDFLICEIAAKSGYPNQNYFCRLFKKTYGMTPSEYRNSLFRNKTF